MDSLLSIVGPILNRLLASVTGKRHKMRLDVQVDTTDSGDLETIVQLTNAGDFFERDVTMTVSASVAHEVHVRFISVQCENSDQVRIEQDTKRTSTKRFATTELILEIDGLGKGDAVCVRALSTEYIPTLKIKAMSHFTLTTYDSTKHAPPLVSSFTTPSA